MTTQPYAPRQRYLVEALQLHDSPLTLEILEVSPSGRHVQVCFDGSKPLWVTLPLSWKIIERLVDASGLCMPTSLWPDRQPLEFPTYPAPVIDTQRTGTLPPDAPQWRANETVPHMGLSALEDPNQIH